MAVSVFPSGERPSQCRNGHPWTGKPTMLVGSAPCDCANAARHFYRHMWIRCRGDDDRCPLTWFDPPCSHLQPPAP